jgi:hypothetical protein
MGFIFAALFLLAGGPDAELQPLLARLGAYSIGYHKHFREFVATEERVQKHYGHNLKVEQRTTVSDYYVVTLPSAPGSMVEFRETLSVDGRATKGTRGKVLELLNRKSKNVRAEADRLARENKCYDLGYFKHFEEYTNMGLLYVDPRVQGHVEYGLAGPQALRFREFGVNTVARIDDEPAAATGFVYFTPEFKVTKVDLTIHDGTAEGPAIVRCVIEYEPGPEGLMLPSRCRHYIPGISEEPLPGGWASEARYTNYRRFTADVKLTTEGPAASTPQ